MTKNVAIPAEYWDYANVFSKQSGARLSKRFNNNKYLNNQELGTQLLYRPNYNLGLLDPEMVNIYIKTNLANDFISPFKFSAKVLIPFV